eukprot:CAMPEP_0175114622 /NCGR_PEP_ID=MMETSP0086_2-20121207/16989_1 /TAXON_ID=136419 /ORGANISM="Unknown Unknown, Strain D1" /LENGTH=169 /DNA_ID=CAMNT_0016394353 /DNA_START=17 /DNA_END=526 /DNA_ORIENTATION=-
MASMRKMEIFANMNEPLSPWDVDTLRYPNKSWKPEDEKVPQTSDTKPQWQYPQMEKLYPGKLPNQHGHPLLPAYKPTQEAAGMGYGCLHKDYYRYLSHYDDAAQEKSDPNAKISVKKQEYESKRGPGFGPNHRAPGLGYGVPHKHHARYISVRNSYDCPEPSYEPYPTQ